MTGLYGRLVARSSRRFDLLVAAAALFFAMAAAFAAYPAIKGGPGTVGGLLLLFGLAGVAGLGLFAFGAPDRVADDGPERLVDALDEAAALVSVDGKVRHANAQLEVKNQELKQQSARDPLTALYNRRHFQEFMRGHQAIERRSMSNNGGASGEEMVSAMFLLDVDHFKHINDTYGHGAGDAVLREIADALREILRETDMIVRWGGEEFLAFLPAVPRGSLDEVARRLLAGIPERSIDYQGTPLSVNVSIGFAPFPLAPGADALSWERAVNLVDMALYLAKGHGRNRAYGVCGLAGLDAVSMDEIEQDLEQAWRAGRVELSIVSAHPPELRLVS